MNKILENGYPTHFWISMKCIVFGYRAWLSSLGGGWCTVRGFGRWGIGYRKNLYGKPLRKTSMENLYGKPLRKTSTENLYERLVRKTSKKNLYVKPLCKTSTKD